MSNNRVEFILGLVDKIVKPLTDVQKHINDAAKRFDKLKGSGADEFDKLQNETRKTSNIFNALKATATDTYSGIVNEIDKASKSSGRFARSTQSFNPVNINAIADSFQSVSDSLSFTEEIGELQNKLATFVPKSELESATR